MKRTLTALVMIVIGLTAGITGAQANNHEQEPPLHAHALLLDIEFGEFGPESYSKCVDVAGNRKLPLNAHHEGIHTGTAGWGNVEVGITRAGHGVAPLYPLTPFANCEELVAAFFPGD